MNSEHLTTLWLGSFRYYLGRKTYAVSEFCDILIAQWETIPDRCKALITKELNNAFAKDDEMRSDPACSSICYPLGMTCDRTEWERVRKYLADKVEVE